MCFSHTLIGTSEYLNVDIFLKHEYLPPAAKNWYTQNGFVGGFLL